VSIDRPLGGWPTIDLPDDFGDSTSWQRARDEESTVEPINRAEWMVRVGDGDRHRVVFGTRSGTPVGECDCKGYTYHEWCAHLAAMLLAYVREEIVVGDLDADLDEELAMLWRQYRRGGEA
jgi:hypothetical protein